MRKTVARTLVAAIIILAAFGFLSGGNAGAARGCYNLVGFGNVCYETGEGSRGAGAAFDGSNLYAVAYANYFSTTGAGIRSGNSLVAAAMYCDESRQKYSIIYIQNNNSMNLATGVKC